jgi:hypothetical protein
MSRIACDHDRGSRAIIQRQHAHAVLTRCCMLISPRPSGSCRVRRSAACTCSLSGPSSCTFTGSPSSHLQSNGEWKLSCHGTCHTQRCHSTLVMLSNANCVPFQLYVHLSAASCAQRFDAKRRSVDVHDELATVMTLPRSQAALLYAHRGHMQILSKCSIECQCRLYDGAVLARMAVALISHHQTGFPHFRGLHVRSQWHNRIAVAPQQRHCVADAPHVEGDCGGDGPQLNPAPRPSAQIRLYLHTGLLQPPKT